jgi:hypothetical protein
VASEDVVGSLLNEVLSDPPAPNESHAPRLESLPQPTSQGDADIRCIALETMVRMRDSRIAELEGLLVQEDGADIIRDELEATRAHAARLEEHLHAQRVENQRLRDEVARLERILEKRSG